MHSLDGKFYSPSLREKAGELRAIRALDDFSKSGTLPIFIALPLSEKENQNLTLDALVRREVGRVQSSWGQRVCVWDPRFLTFDKDDAREDGKWLRELLTQFSLFGGRVIPVVGLRETFHRTSVMSSYAQSSSSGIAIRIEFDDIQEYELLDSVVKNVGTTPDQCILIIDISDADISEPDEFAKPLLGWLYELKSRGNWAKIILTGSSFPRKNPAPIMGDSTSPQLEWRLWTWMAGLDPSIANFVIFGDFGADNSHFKFKGGGRPIPHIRYARADDWQTSRGDKTYASIQGVAKRIAEAPYFRGRNFSEGDEFIYDCSIGRGRTGDPTAWRAVNMNHHITEVIVGLANLYGVTIPLRRTARPQQANLFDDLEPEKSDA